MATMRRAALGIVWAVFVSLSSPVIGQGLILMEGFDVGFSDPAWEGTEYTIDEAHYRSGDGSLRIDGDGVHRILRRDMGRVMINSEVNCWFYDDLVNTDDTIISVSDLGDSGTSMDDLRVGMTCRYADGYYSAGEGWWPAGWHQGPLRSIGWHKVTIRNEDGTNYCYVDDELIFSTNFQGNWRYLNLTDDSLCDSKSWFDDLTVEYEGTMRPHPSTSTATGGPANPLISPAGTTPTLADEGATISIVALNADAVPLIGIPASDFWIEGAVDNGLAFCENGIQADGPTDANGHTTMSGVVYGGGCAPGDIYVVVQGVQLSGSPLSVHVNSPDMTGDLIVDLIDVGQFAQALLGSYSPCADFFKDGVIDLVDVGILAAHIGEACP